MIEEFASWVVFSIFGLQPESQLGEAVHFFVYDSVKILLLLFFMIGAIGVLRTYISQKRIKKLMGSKTFGLSYLAASVFGAITPFCSCSSIPIFMSFIKAGSPLGPAFSFLVTSPLINEYLVVLMAGFFGLKVTALYVVFGIFLGVAAGLLANRMGLEKHLVDDFKNSGGEKDAVYRSFGQRLRYGVSEANSIVKKLWVWVLTGVAVGAAIHGFVPEKVIHSILDSTGPFSVPLAAVVGVPIYANCAAVVPIAVVLFQKGVPLGTALAFMMATSALSLPEAVILRRVMKLPLIATFFTMVTVGIIAVGYVFNAIA